ncbi:MAG: FAD-dependent oxidoreductase [Candidatus Bathyarchaeia archaeon]
MTEVVVLGGGLAGLAACHKLSLNGFRTLLLEKSKDLGGLASSYLIDGNFVPKTYHHVMFGDEDTLNIIKDLGLENTLYWRKLKVGFYSHGKFYDFSSPYSILKFKPLSPVGRIKFGLLVFKARSGMPWDSLDGVNVEDYVLSIAGKEAYKLIDYIVRAKFAEPPANISAAWLMSRFGHESRSVSNKFGYLNDGINEIVNGLATSCIENKCLIKTGAEVTKILFRDGSIKKLEYKEENGKIKTIQPKIVISTLPIPVFLQVSEGLPSDYEELLGNIRYKASLCACLAFSRRISPFYWLNVMDLNRYPFVGAFEHSHLNRNLKWPSLMYLVKYLDVTDHFWRKYDSEIVEEFLDGLSNIFDADLKEGLLWWRLHRAEYSTPIFAPDYGKYKPQVRSPIKGLYIGGISRTYPQDRYMGTALKTGLEAAQAVVDDYI